MEREQEQIQNFMERCDDLLNAKFIIAPSKISDLMRTIATSHSLVTLLESAVAPFNYHQAQEKYLLPSPDGTQNKGVFLLPENNLERIAFIFCLLADIDNGVVSFNLLLQTFFSSDGSYTEAFEQFLLQVIKPFRLAVLEALYPSPIQSPAPLASVYNGAFDERYKHDKKAVIVDLLPLIKAEIEGLASSPLAQADKDAGGYLLKQLLECVQDGNAKPAKALVIGFSYFAMQTGFNAQNLPQIALLCEEL